MDDFFKTGHFFSKVVLIFNLKWIKLNVLSLYPCDILWTSKVEWYTRYVRGASKVRNGTIYLNDGSSSRLCRKHPFSIQFKCFFFPNLHFSPTVTSGEFSIWFRLEDDKKLENTKFWRQATHWHTLTVDKAQTAFTHPHTDTHTHTRLQWIHWK